MRVVFIRSTSIYDDSRATKEIIALADMGHNITVLCWDRYGNSSDKCQEVFKEYQGKIQVIFYKNLIPKGIGIKNIGKLFGFNRWIYSKLRSIKDIDAVHICNLDSALLSIHYCMKHKIRYIYDIYDYYIDSHNIPKIFIPFVERFEIYAINNAEATIICTEERKEQISKACPKKIVVIYNSPEVKDIDRQQVKYDYAYCGALGDKRLLKEIFLLYPQNSDIRFITAGYGEFTDKAAELSDEYENFTYAGTVAYSEVLIYEIQSDVISAIYEPSIRNHRLCAPNKFYEAMALAKPIIVCRGTGIDKVVEENGIGLVIDYNAEEFYKALRFLCSNEKARSDMGTKARILYEMQYNWSLMKDRLHDLYAHLEVKN